MNRTPNWLRLALAAFAVMEAGPVAAQEVGERVIQLTPFVVRDIRPWNHASVPGCEILSIEDAGDTRRIAEQIQRMGRFIPMFFPPGASPSPAGSTVLFIDRFNRGEVIEEAKLNMGITGAITSYTLATHGQAFQFVSREEVRNWITGIRSPAPLRFYAAGLMSRAPLPFWYREEISRLLEESRVSDRSIEVPGRRWLTMSLSELSQLLAIRTQEQMIAIRNRRDPIEGPIRQTGSLFVRWGFFSDGGRRRAAFLDFVAAGGTSDEAALQRYFGMDARELWTSLLDFARGDGTRTFSLSLPRETVATPLPPVVVRPATQVEVGRLVGRSYMHLAERASPEAQARYRRMAREVVGDALAADGPDPALLAVIGELDYREGRTGEARQSLELAARAGRVNDPFFHYLRAILAMEAAGAPRGSGRPLPPEAEGPVLDLLREAVNSDPVLPEAFVTLSTVRLSPGGVAIPAGELDRLAAGVREYPGVLQLRLNVARLAMLSGQSGLARDLVAEGLALPDIGKTPYFTRFQGLHAELGSGDP